MKNLQLVYAKNTQILDSIECFVFLLIEINEGEQRHFDFYELFIQIPVNTAVEGNVLLSTENWLIC